MSYHTPWKWTDDQLNGFKFALKDMDVEYNIFQMDTKNNSSDQWKRNAGREARRLIDSWKPDLVYADDDNAQEYVARYYVNKKLPFVFSGVNADPAKYGFTGSSNITGVLEQEHFVASVNLLKKLVPDIKKIAVILDDDNTWEGVTKRMKAELPHLPQVEFVSWEVINSYTKYKRRMLELQEEVDAVALLGIFTFKDDAGENVSYEEVLKWTANHSILPDFSFWADRISFGTLCTVTVSGYEQGLAAGKIARGIIREGREPGSYAMRPTLKGQPMINLARAKKLGLTVNTEILLSADVVGGFAWE